jgi:hypothetical protein
MVLWIRQGLAMSINPDARRTHELNLAKHQDIAAQHFHTTRFDPRGLRPKQYPYTIETTARIVKCGFSEF